MKTAEHCHVTIAGLRTIGPGANNKNEVHLPNPYSPSLVILLTAALLKLKEFHPIPLACLARELLSMQGTLVNNNQTFSETKLL